MNNPARRAVQRRVEVPLLRRMGGVLAGGRAVEIGCGQGYGAQLAVECFHAGQVLALDIDPRMLRLAGRRVRAHRLPVTLARAGATALPVGDASVDAVFDFGVLHHVGDWHAAVREISRVLRPGGRLFFEDVTAQALARPSYRRFLDHPRHDRFTGDQLVAELQQHGVEVGERRVDLVGGDFVLGVGERRG